MGSVPTIDHEYAEWACGEMNTTAIIKMEVTRMLDTASRDLLVLMLVSLVHASLGEGEDSDDC